VSAEEVKRLTVNRVVDGLLSVRYEGDTMIVPILEEVLIVEKRCMLKEELHISKRRVETHTPQRVTVRSEEVTVERIENPQ
jgi:stress response protein YsnF